MSRRVLIVDDNVALAENIAEILEFEGFLTSVAATAEEALPQALAGDIAVLVTDFRLPGIDGAELIRRARRERKDLRCVVISAFTDEDTVSLAEAAGARFLAKPLDFKRLALFLRVGEGNA